ncbi:MAG: formate dehydrogenase, partial [Hyphomicrobiales bacterium]
MTVKIFVPGDSGAVAVGADAVADALSSGLRARNLQATIVRNGSRGLYWLEPLVEVEVGGRRIAYGPVTPADVTSLLDAGLLEGGAHAKCLGPTEDIPFLKRQTRLTFTRCGIVDP